MFDKFYLLPVFIREFTRATAYVSISTFPSIQSRIKFPCRGAYLLIQFSIRPPTLE